MKGISLTLLFELFVQASTKPVFVGTWKLDTTKSRLQRVK